MFVNKVSKISDLSDSICQSYISLVNKVNFKILKNKLFYDSIKTFSEKSWTFRSNFWYHASTGDNYYDEELIITPALNHYACS